MPKSKRGTALFDLFPEEGSGRTDTLSVPVSQGQPEGGRGSQAVAQNGSVDQISTRGSVAAAEATATQRGRKRRVELAGDRICFSLTSVSAGLAVFVALALFVGVFDLGRDMGHRSGYGEGVADGRSSFEAGALSEIEEARRKPPATEVLDGLIDDSPAKESVFGDDARAAISPTQSDASSGSSGWVRGFTYIVAQEFSVRRPEDAAKAQAFLATNGVATEIVTYPSGAIQLITTQGFNRSDPAQREMADRLHSRVRLIGARYSAGGGGYKLSGYLKTLKGDRW